MVKYLDKAGLEHLVNGLKNLLYGKVDKISGKGLSDQNYTLAEKSKLAGIAVEANKYVHPASHDASMINQSASYRFVTDNEKSTWNSKASTAAATESTAGLMPAADKKLINGIKAITNTEIDAAAK